MKAFYTPISFPSLFIKKQHDSSNRWIYGVTKTLLKILFLMLPFISPPPSHSALASLKGTVGMMNPSALIFTCWLNSITQFSKKLLLEVISVPPGLQKPTRAHPAEWKPVQYFCQSDFFKHQTLAFLCAAGKKIPLVVLNHTSGCADSG